MSAPVLYQCEREKCKGTSYIEAYCPHCGWHRNEKIIAKEEKTPRTTSKYQCKSCLTEGIVRQWCIHCGERMTPVNGYQPNAPKEKKKRLAFNDPSLNNPPRWFDRTIFGKQECDWCGRTGDLTVHHFHPRSKGGNDDVNNRLVLCRSHHDLIHITRVNDRDGFSARVHEMLTKHNLRLPPLEVKP